MVIERTILLHQDDDVLDIANRARAVVRRNRERLWNVAAHAPVTVVMPSICKKCRRSVFFIG